MVRVFLTLLSAGLVGLALTAPAAETSSPTTDWVQFRGPNRDGISPDKGLLTQWPKDGPKLIWKAEGLGIGFSSVSVAGSRIFTMGDTKGQSYVICVDRTSGEKLWATEVGKAGGNYSGTRCTPTVDDNRVYVLGQFGDLVCIEASSGKEIWRKNFPKDFGGKAGGWNFCESVLIDGPKLLCTPGGKDAIVALDKLTGKDIWRAPINSSAGYSSMVISEACGRRQYVQLLASGVVSVDAETGKVLWKYEKLGNNIANIPNPIVLGDQIFCTAGYGKAGALLSISKNGSNGLEAKEDYYVSDLKNRHGGVIRLGDYVYGDVDHSGKMWCAEWKTGKVQWSNKERVAGKGSIAIVYADGHLYCRYDNGILALVEASPKGYVEKASFKVPGSTNQSWNHPVVIDGRLYLREKDTLLVYDLKNKA
jgi:outer membrane protein assembly factor BamB